MNSVAGQQNQNNEVWDQQCQIEGIDVIKAPESRIEEMLANVRLNPFRAGEHQQRREYRQIGAQ